METYNFFVQDVTPDKHKTEFVTLQSGRGKAKFSKIFIHPIGFSYIEGLIWDRYREFTRQKKDKIPSHEWKRVLLGFQVALKKLKTNSIEEGLEDILKFEIINPEYALEDVLENIGELASMLEEIYEWVSNQVTLEKYIYVLKP